MSEIARTPVPPYYAVIFTSLRTEGDGGYADMNREMDALVRQQPGFLGVESARDGLGVTVSYWESLEAISNWKRNMRHLVAQQRGRSEWYSMYSVRVCRVEREYVFRLANDGPGESKRGD